MFDQAGKLLTDKDTVYGHDPFLAQLTLNSGSAASAFKDKIATQPATASSAGKIGGLNIPSTTPKLPIKPSVLGQAGKASMLVGLGFAAGVMVAMQLGSG